MMQMGYSALRYDSRFWQSAFKKTLTSSLNMDPSSRDRLLSECFLAAVAHADCVVVQYLLQYGAGREHLKVG